MLRPRAAVLSHLARATWEGVGDAAEASAAWTRRWRWPPIICPPSWQSLTSTTRRQWEQAYKAAPRQAVRRMRNQPEQAAKLTSGWPRCTRSRQARGGLSPAVRGHRMGPGQLLTKLSLGENRFRAGSVARGRSTSAASPIIRRRELPGRGGSGAGPRGTSRDKLRNPERAMAMYEAAIGLRARHRASLQALANLALERGEKQRAARLSAPPRRRIVRSRRARSDAGTVGQYLRRARRRSAGSQGRYSDAHKAYAWHRRRSRSRCLKRRSSSGAGQR